MYGWKKASVYGKALSGERCVVAKVSVPADFTREEAHEYIVRTHPHWVSKPELKDIEVPT